jgi:2-oxoglutarate ferredoxin oxidoreductase subunit gamma
MSQEAYGTYSKQLGKEGMLIYDEDLVTIDKKACKQKKWRIHSIPATRLAEELGRKIVANIVMLGFFTAVSKTVSYEAMKNAILSSVPKGTEKLNESAFNKGYEYKENSN